MINRREDKREGPDVIFMTMGKNQSLDLAGILQQKGNIRNNNVNSKKLLVWKHQAGVDDDHLVPVTEDHHVHTKFAQPA